MLELFLTQYSKIREHFKTWFLVKLPTKTVTALRTDSVAFTALIVSLHQTDYALSLTVLFWVWRVLFLLAKRLFSILNTVFMYNIFLYFVSMELNITKLLYVCTWWVETWKQLLMPRHLLKHVMNSNTFKIGWIVSQSILFRKMLY